MASVDEILKKARAEIGTKENPAGSNKVKYNTWFYGREVQGAAYPWCCAFICWLFKDEPKLITKTASCSTLATWFKKNNQWFSKPQPGDLVFYNFHTPGKIADHIGIVESVNTNGTITAIEGNTSVTSDDNGGSVMRRQRKAKIVGYGRPKYTSDKITNTTRKTLLIGSRGADVVYLKKRLTSMGFGNLELENDIYTKGTADAVQYIQVTNNLTPDRICGPKTWEVIDK